MFLKWLAKFFWWKLVETSQSESMKRKNKFVDWFDHQTTESCGSWSEFQREKYEKLRMQFINLNLNKTFQKCSQNYKGSSTLRFHGLNKPWDFLKTSENCCKNEKFENAADLIIYLVFIVWSRLIGRELSLPAETEYRVLAKIINKHQKLFHKKNKLMLIKYEVQGDLS